MNENDARAQIADICRKMWQLGWVAANDGNISVKLEDDVFLTTPTGISKCFVTEKMLVKITALGEIIEAADGFRPSSEIKMHLRCYKERNDIGAVLHAHPPTATGFAVAHIPLDGKSMIETVLTMGPVPCTPYATPSTDEVSDSVAPFLADHDVLLLENHGALTLGADLITAFYRMESLEHLAKITLTARLLGGEKPISDDNIDRLVALRPQYGITGRQQEYKKA